MVAVGVGTLVRSEVDVERCQGSAHGLWFCTLRDRVDRRAPRGREQTSQWRWSRVGESSEQLHERIICHAPRVLSKELDEALVDCEVEPHGQRCLQRRVAHSAFRGGRTFHTVEQPPLDVDAHECVQAELVLEVVVQRPCRHARCARKLAHGHP